MQFKDFCRRSRSEQLYLLRNEGIYIGKRKEGDTISLLFQVDSFYVEIEYICYRKMVKRINVYATTECLDPYLEGMEFPQFLQENRL